MRRLVARIRLLPFIYSGLYLLLVLLAVYLHGTAWDVAGQWLSVSPVVGILLSWVCRDLFCGWWHLQCHMPIIPAVMVDATIGDESMTTIIVLDAMLLFLLVVTSINAIVVFGKRKK